MSSPLVELMVKFLLSVKIEYIKVSGVSRSMALKSRTTVPIETPVEKSQ